MWRSPVNSMVVVDVHPPKDVVYYELLWYYWCKTSGIIQIILIFGVDPCSVFFFPITSWLDVGKNCKGTFTGKHWSYTNFSGRHDLHKSLSHQTMKLYTSYHTRCRFWGYVRTLVLVILVTRCCAMFIHILDGMKAPKQYQLTSHGSHGSRGRHSCSFFRKSLRRPCHDMSCYGGWQTINFVHPCPPVSTLIQPCPTIQLSNYGSVYLSICPFVYLSIYLPIHPSIHPSIHACMHACMHPHVHTYI